MSLQLNIEKLKGKENYRAWHLQVRAYLEMEGLWSYVQGPNEQYSNFGDGRRAYFVILCLIESSVINQLECIDIQGIHTGNASQIWKYLMQEYFYK